MNTHKEARGFTLIELLVVIAIIAMLASIILASLNQARSKSRDARRVADLKQVQLALELFNSDNGRYPSQATAGSLGDATPSGIYGDLVPSYISALPQDPGSYTYWYQSLDSGAVTAAACSSSCISYVLRAQIENNNTSLLNADVDGTVAGVTCTDTSTAYYYCVRP